jgi:hypothetical protein
MAAAGTVSVRIGDPNAYRIRPPASKFKFVDSVGRRVVAGVAALDASDCGVRHEPPLALQ